MQHLAKKHDGFTLLELMITLVIAGIISTIAIPSFTQLIQSDRLSFETNKFIGAISTARSEASSRGESVLLCPVISPDLKNYQCGESSDWSQWKALITNSGELISIIEPINNTDVNYIDGNNQPLDRLIISSIGRIRLPGRFIFCETDQSRSITLDQTGHTNITQNDLTLCGES